MNIFDSRSRLNILLVRAGSTELDVQGRITGSLDMPLSHEGAKEVEATASELNDLEIDAIVSAACLSAKQTAKQLSEQWAVRMKVEEGLTNLDHGLWHGKSLEELKETQPKLYRQWNDNPESVCPPGGETIELVKNRITKSLTRIKRKYKNGIVAVVAPEPLYSIIRSVIEDSEPKDLFDKGESMWVALSLAVA